MNANVMMELTWRCNAACSFCYLGRTGRLNGRTRELGEAGVKKFMRRFPPGTRFYFSGGEPFLRKDIYRLLAYAAGRGFVWGVNTNGLAFGRFGVRRLMALRPSYVIFSLHGPAALHDRLTGVKGAHSRLLAALKEAAAARLPGTELMTNCVINAENAALLPAVYLEAARAGADRAVFEHLQFLKRGEAARAGLPPSGVVTPVLENYSMDVPALAESVRRLKALRGAFRTQLGLRPDFSRRELERYYNGTPAAPGACAGLMDVFNVEPDGRLRACVLCSAQAGKAGVFDAAAARRAKRRLLKGAVPAACARCCQRFAIEKIF